MHYETEYKYIYFYLNNKYYLLLMKAATQVTSLYNVINKKLNKGSSSRK